MYYRTFALLLVLLSMSACQQYVIDSSPMAVPSDNGVFRASIQALCNDGCRALALNVDNMTTSDIEIVWDKTLYIQNGKTNGGFAFEGIPYKDRNGHKPNDVVFAGSNFNKVIYPCNLVSYTPGRFGGWKNEAFLIGENGVYLTVLAGDKEYREKISVDLQKRLVDQ